MRLTVLGKCSWVCTKLRELIGAVYGLLLNQDKLKPCSAVGMALKSSFVEIRIRAKCVEQALENRELNLISL